MENNRKEIKIWKKTKKEREMRKNIREWKDKECMRESHWRELVRMQENREGKKIIVIWEKREKSKLDVIEQNLNWDERKNEKRERGERKWEKWETWMRENISESVMRVYKE